MHRILERALATVIAILLTGHCLQLRAEPLAQAKEQVTATERAFAKTMADRNLPMFSKFVSKQAVFFSGQSYLRGRPKITDAWAKYFNGPQAPFSWIRRR